MIIDIRDMPRAALEKITKRVYEIALTDPNDRSEIVAAAVAAVLELRNELAEALIRRGDLSVERSEATRPDFTGIDADDMPEFPC